MQPGLPVYVKSGEKPHGPVLLSPSSNGLERQIFFAAVGNSFHEGDDSSSYYATKIVYKIGTIMGYIFFVYLLGRLLKMITGEEIVIEQEIVVVEEVTKSQLEAEERKQGNPVNDGGTLKKSNGSARQRRGKRG
mmetsp:Transcript_28072/g.57672  ORF Transcript_28072/g.57672 Transcript_28072/m.57672 type:complete len:134 (-) Transcript_28072:1822-2223(-)